MTGRGQKLVLESNLPEFDQIFRCVPVPRYETQARFVVFFHFSSYFLLLLASENSGQNVFHNEQQAAICSTAFATELPLFM